MYSYIHVRVLLLIIVFGHYKSLFSLGISKVKDFSFFGWLSRKCLPGAKSTPLLYGLHTMAHVLICFDWKTPIT